MMDIDTEKLDEVLSQVRGQLLSMRTEGGYWRGELSSSALATAVAVGALALTDGEGHKELVDGGIRWLCENANDDGGWGDTTVSESNISTTILCWAAFGMSGADEQCSETVKGAEQWLTNAAGGLSPEQLTETIYRRYGADRTFAVPILTMCALAGRLGENPWKMIVPLPFELAVFPHKMYKWLNLSVVSYALAALIAIGQAHFHNYKPPRRFTGLMRKAARAKTLKKLAEIQPENGGFLEAPVLTGFVVMSLASAGQRENVVTKKGVQFIRSSMRPDGSWPIDTDLATWVTTLSVNAISQSPDGTEILDEDARRGLLKWIMNQQFEKIHLYVHADPGGWAWTDNPGGVPDADDTAGALIALSNLSGDNGKVLNSACRGLLWLMNIQNKDGGIPTFCRGWKDLPFDRSSPDLSAHTLAAMGVWIDKVDGAFADKIRESADKVIDFLSRCRHSNGSWIPLWFGNEGADNQQNPTYGTARVLLGLSYLEENLLGKYYSMVIDGTMFLVRIQNEDGGWGGAEGVESSIEETALATDALAALLAIKGLHGRDGFRSGEIEAAVEGGVKWLMDRFLSGEPVSASPIGLYFASLWYHEKLYPWIFTVSALQRVANLKDQTDL